MSFLDHLEELRWTLIKSVITFAAAFGLVAYFITDFADWLNWPLNVGMRDHPEVIQLVTTTPLGVFSVFMTVGVIGAVTLSLPFILFFIGQFVGPALTGKERRLLLPGCAAALLLFLVGGLFSFFFLAPSVIRFSAMMNSAFGYQVIWSADRYYSMLLWMVVGMGAAFQFPLVVQILVYLELVSVARLRSWRRIAFFICFVAGALITPTPDPFNMSIVAVPLYLLYEVAIWVASVYTVPKLVQARAAVDEA